MEQNLADTFGITPVSVQLLLLTVSFALGVLIILLYTGYSAVIDKCCKGKRIKRRIMLAVSDISFWISMAFTAFIVYYRLDDAAIRVYYFIFILCGMITAYNIKLRIIKNKKNF